MSVTRDEVRHIASLARLRFTETEEEVMAAELSRILAYVEQLRELDTSAVAPMAHVLDVRDVFRDDRVEQRISHEEALMNAPAADGDYCRVPKVIE
jgi:aspartyl-tRNA(Asn)/glutamyl-tRNA(Gln) amidotransferase subunit C